MFVPHIRVICEGSCDTEVMIINSALIKGINYTDLHCK